MSATDGEIKRRVELFLRGQLRNALPARKFFPSKGGDEAEPDTQILPPFGVITCRTAERVIADEGTWQCEVEVAWFTHMDDAPAPMHSAMVREVLDALCVIPRRSSDFTHDLTIHGFDVGTASSISDKDAKGRGDIIPLVLGCSG